MKPILALSLWSPSRSLLRVGILACTALCYHELLPCVFLKAGRPLHSTAQAMAQCCQQPTGWPACAICPRVLRGHRIQCRAVPCASISNRSTFFCFPTIHDFDICGKYTAVAAECLTVGPLAISMCLDLGPVFLAETLQNTVLCPPQYTLSGSMWRWFLILLLAHSFYHLARVVLARFLHCRLNEFCDF